MSRIFKLIGLTVLLFTLTSTPLVIFAAPADYMLLEPTLVAGSEGNTLKTLSNASTGATDVFANYFQLLYQVIMAAGVIAAVGMFVWGGFEYMFSEVPYVKVKGKANILRALEGLAFLLGAYLILNTINPRLTHIELGLIKVNPGEFRSVTGGYGTPSGSGGVYTPPPPINNPCVTGGASKKTAAYIISNEGWFNHAYTDSRGFPTIGVGHLITANDNFGGSLTDSQVTELFASDYSKYAASASALAQQNGVDFNSLSPERQTVLIDMTFNLGGKLDNFKEMWDGIKSNDWKKAGDEIMDSSYAGQVGSRAPRNADIMRTSNDNPINSKISSDTHARNYCQ